MNANALPASPALPVATPGPSAAGSGSAGSTPADLNEPSTFARELQAAQATPTATSSPTPAATPKPPSRSGRDGAEGSTGAPRSDTSAQHATQGEDGPETAGQALLRWLTAARDGRADPEQVAEPVDDASVGDVATTEEGGASATDGDADTLARFDTIAVIPSSQAGTARLEAPEGTSAAVRSASAAPADGIDSMPTPPMNGARVFDTGNQGAASNESDPESCPSTGAASTQPMPGFAAELARSAHAIGHPSVHAQPDTEVRLATPVHSQQFMPHLAGELVLLARDGVQEARVQLHPAELGPIAVRITLDGSSAQVRLAVDSAFTRDLLEQGLPTLAAAMRENGITLSGGGVFQQPRDPARDGQDGARSGQTAHESGQRGEEPPTQEAGARVQRLRHAGRLDVFA